LNRSTKVTIKYANRDKKEFVSKLVDEYKHVMNVFIDILWRNELTPKFLPSNVTSRVQKTTWLSARMLQAAGKQASGIIRGTRKKQSQRKFVIEKLVAEGKLKEAKKLQKIYDETSISKPDMRTLELELDSRFVRVDLDNDTSFDCWLDLHSLSSNERGEKIFIPFKKHRHFEKMLKRGRLISGCRLSKKSITFNFEIPDAMEKISGSTVGVDVGLLTTLSCSDNQVVNQDCHGHTYKSICEKLSKKIKGSRSFKRAVQHRKNYVGWCVNQLDFSRIKKLNRENIKYLKHKKRTRRLLQHWSYAEIFKKLDSKCEELGVRVSLLDPAYTSRRCSVCGWVRRGDRDGKLFTCSHCGNACDADVNASRNIALDLRPVTAKERQLFKSGQGFFWKVGK